ncbi:tripartite tricarboxylate transporter substrate binding protein [Plastoroseomonas hellenica]|uniref:tripartite tricarboxylate transporter substrate binding protein n=1 Tax=Plastoroseomonas hellenica TaxID=2687306 RepID=UPI001BA80483|nr:tripartite tricarboxylate transporter substrate binding protein [Plastoroseomonas hellenica]MBR0646454.1 tripartite tricarboxylate transporter substrate binding protein [Plastoroseomonas hellenica]
MEQLSGAGIRRRGLLLGATLPLLQRAAPARAQAPWPSRPIRVIVPYPPGGGSDTVARLIYPRLSARLGQPIIVENRSGATGTIGETAAARSDPDGYTLLHDAAAITVNRALFPTLPFDLERDLQPVTLAVTFPNLLLANPAMPVRDVPGLIAMAKASPRGLDWASSGTGSNQHLSMVLFARAAGIALNHIPYRGGGPAVADVIAGQVPFAFGSASGTTSHARSGLVRAIAHTGTGRLPALPEVPAIAETLPGFESVDWQGVFVRKGTAAGILDRLAAELSGVFGEPEIAERILEIGAQSRPMRVAEFEAYVQAETQKWGAVVREANIRME